MYRVLRLLALSLLFSLTGGGSLWASENGAIVRREVLALFDGSKEKAPSDTLIHRFAEMPLNYLGFSLVYRDVRNELPVDGELRRFAAVLSWFEEPPRSGTNTSAGRSRRSRLDSEL